MYVVSCRELKLKSGLILRMGDHVPDADLWPENIKKANIDMGYIKEVVTQKKEVPRWLVAQAAINNASPAAVSAKIDLETPAKTKEVSSKKKRR